MAETHAVQAIIDYAMEQGITDLFLIDEDFVKSALFNERARRERQALKPQTNFDRITENTEALAEFFATYGISCVQRGNKCDTGKNCKECIKEWLQKECEG